MMKTTTLSPGKSLQVWLVCALYFLLASLCNAQVNSKEKAAVLQLDSKGFALDPIQMGNLARLELDKLGIFEVMDRYDVDYLLEKEQIKLENCYGKICLVEVGRKLKVDKMLTGSVELLGENIVVTLRLIDVGTQTVEKSQVMEFLNLKNSVQTMLGLSLQKMFGLALDENMVSKLTKPYDYESALNTPDVGRLNLSGPRMGVVMFGGLNGDILGMPEGKGGLDAYPLMFQFGYQFETAYLNQGRLQALFEFIPMVTGLDQGLVLPSISILHGVRDNRTGFEFAFGPVVNLTKEARGFVNPADGQWTLYADWQKSHPGELAPGDVLRRLDSRGTPMAGTGFVFAAGKSFKSGKLNIPVNAFFIPGRDGHRFGISIGFNGRGG